MDFFEREMRSMFQNSAIIQEPTFYGKTMLGKLDDDLRIKLEFVSRGIANEFFTVQLSIINRTQGLVDTADFYFSDIIGYYQRHANASPMPYHMWIDDGKAKWYTPITQEQKAAIADRVLDYAELYLEQGMTFGEQLM